MIISELVCFELPAHSRRKINFPGQTRPGLAARPAPGLFPDRAIPPSEAADMPTESESSKVVTAHGVYDDGALRMTATLDPPGLAIAGEIDEDTYPALVAGLEELAGAGEIHLNLADVQFCDLAGLRAMIRLAGSGRRSDSRQIVLHEVPPRLQTVLGILGWGSTPGLVIDQSAGG
jgi:ABC-type transporter Mla MlaB component